MRIGAVLVHFRFWPQVERALDALDAQTRAPDVLLVADDCSGDGSVEALQRARPDLEVLVAPSNRGVVANFNAGGREMLARGVDAFCVLTHETVLERDALELLAAQLEREQRVGAAGPLLGFLDAPDTVFSAGGQLLERTWQNPHAGMYEPLDAWRGRGARRVAWLDGACMLIRAEAFGAAGPFPERYFHYYDDVELGVRLNQAGWEVRCVTDAVAHQAPGPLAEYLRVRNRLGFLSVCAPRRVLARALAAHLAQTARDAGPSGDRALAAAQLRALRDAALGRWGRAPARYTAARRHDHAIGGALHEPAPRSWSLPPGYSGPIGSTVASVCPIAPVSLRGGASAG